MDKEQFEKEQVIEMIDSASISSLSICSLNIDSVIGVVVDNHAAIARVLLVLKDLLDVEIFSALVKAISSSMTSSTDQLLELSLHVKKEQGKLESIYETKH